MLEFEQLIGELERTGHRRLVVLSGEAQWTLTQALALRDALPGDWVRLDEHPSKAISGLLGRILYTISAGRLTPIPTRLSGISAARYPFRLYPTRLTGSLPAAHRSASRLRSWMCCRGWRRVSWPSPPRAGAENQPWRACC